MFLAKFCHWPKKRYIHSSCWIQDGLVLTSMKFLLRNPQNKLDLSCNFYHNLKLKYLIISDMEITYTLQISLWTLTVELFISKANSKRIMTIVSMNVVKEWLNIWLCGPMNCSLPGSSVHGILKARIWEWVAIPFFRGSSPPRVPTQVSCTTAKFFTIWATREAPNSVTYF